MPQPNTIHVYAGVGIKEKLAELAKAHKRSQSAEVQFLIDQAHNKEFSDATESDLQRPRRNLV